MNTPYTTHDRFVVESTTLGGPYYIRDVETGQQQCITYRYYNTARVEADTLNRADLAIRADAALGRNPQPTR
jgi:hypothetical protein